MGNDPKNPGGEGEDLLSKLFDQVEDEIPESGSKLSADLFGGSTRVDGSPDDTEARSRISTLKPAASGTNPGLSMGEDRTEFLSPGESKLQEQDLFAEILKDKPEPEQRISFFDVKNEPSSSESPSEATELLNNPFGGGSRNQTLVLGEAEEVAEAADPIEDALQQFEPAEKPFQLNKENVVGRDKAPSDETEFEPPSEISRSDFAPADLDAESVKDELEAGFSQKSEVSAEDFAEVFAQDPIQVPEAAKPHSKKFQFSPAMLKAAGFFFVGAALIGALVASFMGLRSDEGLMGYRLDGWSFGKAYRAPSADQVAKFQVVFKKSEESLLKDSPQEMVAVVAELESVLAEDERNAEAISRILDHSAHLIWWYGVASPWSQKFDESLNRVNEIAQKRKALIENIIVERAKAQRAMSLGEFVSAKESLERALSRFNAADDLSLILMGELNSSLGDNKAAETWLGKVTDSRSPRLRLIKATVTGDRSQIEALSAEGYLPARVASVTATALSPDKLKDRALFAEALMLEIKDHPQLILRLREYKGDIHAALNENDKAIEQWKPIVEQLPKEIRIWFKLADLYIKEHRWDDAIAAFQSIEKSGTLMEDFVLRYADLLRVRGRLAEATQLLNRGFEKFPKSAAIQSQLGRVQFSLKQWDAARTAFERAIKLQPGYEPATLGLVDIHLERKEWAEASVLLKTIPSSSPEYAQALVSLARLAALNGERQEAEGQYFEALRLNPKIESIYPNLVNLLIQRESSQEALSVIQIGEKNLPSSPWVEWSRIRYLQFERNYDEALNRLKPLKASYDHLLRVHFLEADILIDKGELQSAFAIIGPLLKKEISEPDLTYLRMKLFHADIGNIIRDVAGSEQALKELDGILRLNPENESYRLLVAKIALRAQDRNLSQENIDYVLKRNSKSAEAWGLQGELFMELGRYDQASKAFQKALELTKFRSQLYNKLAESFKQQGQAGLAIQYYQKVTKERSSDAEAFLELGKLLNQEGRYQGAIKALARAVQLNPKLSEGFYFLGFIQKELGNQVEALKNFERFLALKPDGTEAATIQDEIYFLKKGLNSAN